MKNFALLISFIIILESASSEDPYRSAKIRRKFGTMKERDDFVQWRQKHKKRYRTLDDETEASEKWLENYDRIQKHNKAFKEGKVAFKQGLWEYSDLSDDEKENTLLGLKAPPVNRNAPIPAELPQFPIGPMFINWTAEGLTSPVGNQGNCGSCWAWSALGVIDSVIRRKMINLTVSAQQLVDCSKRFCWGCSSGWPKYALDYVQANGIASESSYPYFARNQNCTYDTSMSVTVSVLNKTYNIPTRGNETWLRDIVASVGPVSIAMCINSTFFSYKSGVYYQEGCGMSIMHAMLITGYGTDPDSGDYWIIKNSWGTSWGEDGYARVARNRNNMCNVAYYAVYAT